MLAMNEVTNNKKTNNDVYDIKHNDYDNDADKNIDNDGSHATSSLIG